MIPYMVGKLALNSSHLTKGLVKYVPGRGYFRAVLSQNGDKYVTPPPPPIVVLVYYPAQLINIYSFYMCDLYIIYLYAYILFATPVCMLVYCVNYYIYNRGISGIHFLWR